MNTFFLLYKSYLARYRHFAQDGKEWAEKVLFFEKNDLPLYKSERYIEVACEISFYKALQLIGPLAFTRCSKRRQNLAFAVCPDIGGTFVLDMQTNKILCYDEDFNFISYVAHSQWQFEKVTILLLEYELDIAKSFATLEDSLRFNEAFQRRLVDAAGGEDCLPFFKLIYPAM